MLERWLKLKIFTEWVTKSNPYEVTELHLPHATYHFSPSFWVFFSCILPDTEVECLTERG
jgi:hypothetical protein